MSLAHHHDGITGTAKQHVADDYNMRISRGALPFRAPCICSHKLCETVIGVRSPSVEGSFVVGDITSSVKW